MSSTADDRWYAFVRFAGEEHVREGIPESVREHTLQLAREHRTAEESTDA